jgi:PAS domain S-box-containing protein
MPFHGYRFQIDENQKGWQAHERRHKRQAVGTLRWQFEMLPVRHSAFGDGCVGKPTHPHEPGSLFRWWPAWARRIMKRLGKFPPRRGAQMQMREIESLLRHSGAAIYSQDLEAKILTWSAGAEKLLGYGAQEALGRNALELLLAERERSEIPAIAERVRAAGERAFERALRKKSGEEIDAQLWCYPYFDDKGEKRGEVTIARDISAENRIRHALAEAQERYRTLVEYAPDSITVQEDGIFRYVNAATVALAGAWWTSSSRTSMATICGACRPWPRAIRWLPRR